MSSETRNPPVAAFRDNPSAPLVFFDFCQTYGVVGGTVVVALTARVVAPGENDAIPVTVPVAHLRCTPAGAQNLVSALTSALKMLEQPQQIEAARLN